MNENFHFQSIAQLLQIRWRCLWRSFYVQVSHHPSNDCLENHPDRRRPFGKWRAAEALPRDPPGNRHFNGTEWHATRKRLLDWWLCKCETSYVFNRTWRKSAWFFFSAKIQTHQVLNWLMKKIVLFYIGTFMNQARSFQFFSTLNTEKLRRCLLSITHRCFQVLHAKDYFRSQNTFWRLHELCWMMTDLSKY